MHAKDRIGTYFFIWFAVFFAPATWAETPYGLMSFQTRDTLRTDTARPGPSSQNNWTGFYLGGQLTATDLDQQDAPGTADGRNFGFHAGYDHDFGTIVLGGGIEYQQIQINDTDGMALDASIRRLKLTAGYDIGRGLLYGTVGAAQFDSDLGRDEGAFGGIGLRYQIADHFSAGGELLTHHFGDIDGQGRDLNTNLLALRGAFRF